ncbi:MAG: iron ABC transporter substrate-binding protein [Anaerolineales bacterium]|nr:iron ABC transporter substrate-binding protein [Anaerolineales bacterium]
MFGTEAQDKATALAGQVAQAAALAGVELSEEEPTLPAEPIVITATAPEASTAPAAAGGTLVIYSGRGEELVGPLIEQFEQDSGIVVEVRYGSTAEMAATILEEGDNSPADLYYGQDAGALGALAKEGRLLTLPDDILAAVDPRFRSPEGMWIGTSGRARVIVYDPARVAESDLPDDIFGLCAPEWKGRVGWAPTNGSFQAFVTALRVLEGEERAREWLTCMQANEPVVFPNNGAQLEAVAAGEIDAGLVNHYYLYQFLAENPDFPVRNHHLPAGDAGSIVNIAGAGIINTAANPEAAEAFIRYMLSEAGQTYFNTQTHEYPLSAEIEVNPLLVPLADIKTPDLDLSNLDDLDGTLTLLQELGIL